MGIGSLNERLGERVDGQLQPVVKGLPSFLRDTNNLLAIMDKFEWCDDFAWLTCDVSSLYSSIPHDLAHEAISYSLVRYTELSPDLREFILEALDYLLTHNYFTFDWVVYLQIENHDGNEVYALICQPVYGLVEEVPHLWRWEPL